MSEKTQNNLAGFLRVFTVGILVAMQLFLVLAMINILREDAVIVYASIEVVAVITIFILVSRHGNPSSTITWVLVISLIPAFGYALYLLWGRSSVKGTRPDKIRKSIAYGNRFLEKDPAVYNKLVELHPGRKWVAGYLGRKGFPLYEGTACEYFSLGEHQFDSMIADMERAEKFIFLEYFILSSGELWERVSDVLRRKAGEGVEIRLMYDDFGSITKVPKNILKDLRACGIRVVRFNQIHEFISKLYINYRNHQKIAVIDGNIGYTGGTNLADEYINFYPKHGHWKDTAIRLEGDAVWSLTVTFLQMWDGETGEVADYGLYRPTVTVRGEGFFQPFTDGPVNNPDNPAEVTYINIIANAKEYVYITTPYLVIDYFMMETLMAAAIGGVDVRIITPKVWDRWYVHAVTRSNYTELLAAGVKIYEYTPGYIHAKTIISDGDHGITGSINMDYRSFNLHFENAVWICGAPVLNEIKRDIEETIAVSEEITSRQMKEVKWYERMIGSVLRILAPIL